MSDNSLRCQVVHVLSGGNQEYVSQCIELSGSKVNVQVFIKMSGILQRCYVVQRGVR